MPRQSCLDRNTDMFLENHKAPALSFLPVPAWTPAKVCVHIITLFIDLLHSQCTACTSQVCKIRYI